MGDARPLPDLVRGLRAYRAVSCAGVGVMAQGLDDVLGIVLTLAQVLREEFGVGIDAHPGSEGVEAGAVDRAFLAATRVIIATGDDAQTALSLVLRQAALRRLSDLGVRPDEAEALASCEPRLGDRWLAYLALAPTSVIDDLFPIQSSGHEPAQ